MLERLQYFNAKVMAEGFRLADFTIADATLMAGLSCDEILEYPPVPHSLQVCFDPFSITTSEHTPEEILVTLKHRVTDAPETQLYTLIAVYIMWLLCFLHEPYTSERLSKAIFDLSLLRTVTDYKLPIFAV